MNIQGGQITGLDVYTNRPRSFKVVTIVYNELYIITVGLFDV